MGGRTGQSAALASGSPCQPAASVFSNGQRPAPPHKGGKRARLAVRRWPCDDHPTRMVLPKARPLPAAAPAAVLAAAPEPRGLRALVASRASERPAAASAEVPEFRAVYDEHFAFVWRGRSL